MNNLYITNLGIKIFLINLESVNTVNITIHLPIGASSENKEEIGTAHFLEHMLFTKTKKYEENDIDDIIDNYGAKLNAETHYDKTIYYINGMAKYTKELFDILFEIYFNSIITNDKFEREKKIIIQEIENIKMSLDYENDKIATNTIFNNRYNIDISGDVEDIKKLTLEKLINFKTKYYKLDITTIIFFGKLNIKEILCDIENRFGILRVYNPTYLSLNNELIKSNNYNKPILKILKINNQSQINLYFNTINIYNEWYYKLNILINILNIYLYKKLRTEKGLIYSINCYLNINKNAGYLNISFNCAKINIIKCIKIIYDILYYKLNNKYIKTKYITKSINIYHTSLLYFSEQSKYKLLNIIKSLTYNIKSLSVDEIIDIVQNTSQSDIQKISKVLFHKNNTLLIIN
jgi:predicted Zn-dependent peptidase